MSVEGVPLKLGRRTLVARASGALWWAEERLLAFADLHLEKGSSYAAHGALLPPYDTRDTLLRMTAEIDRLDPAAIICLGDSFHDLGAWARMQGEDAALLAALAHRRRWVWIAGNHDAALPPALPGVAADMLALGGLVFRHRAEGGRAAAEVSGHYHPKVSVQARGKAVVRRAFLEDGRRLVMPAFGAYAGGLDAGDPALRALFPRGCLAHVLGRTRVFSLRAAL
ncbi:MAG: ligase-associated DNA damage response endonuclease PdeM [Candidatus Odyssella sp.]|nr:ligase-associated DNA damage response endonuclease PdeM [Candidatus Odyssella sp.]